MFTTNETEEEELIKPDIVVGHKDGSKTYIDKLSRALNHAQICKAEKNDKNERALVEYLADRSEDEQEHVTEVVDKRQMRTILYTESAKVCLG